MAYYLKHSGILGQKWGHRNGPPYPLDPVTDYSAAEKKANNIPTKSESPKTKATVLPKAQDVYKNRQALTDQELRDYLTRVNLERQVKDLALKEYQSEHKLQTYVKSKVKAAGTQTVDSVIKRTTGMASAKLSKMINDELFGSSKTSDKNSNKTETKEAEKKVNSTENTINTEYKQVK